MDFDIVSDLNDLEQEILITFKYWYDCDFEADITHPSYVAARDNIILRMQRNDFLKNPLRVTVISQFPNDPSFKPSQIYDFFIKIDLLKSEKSSLSIRECKKRFSELLMAYVEVMGAYHCCRNARLERKVGAIRAVRARYDKKLLPRREILYRVLREQCALNGHKWKSLNQAVAAINPILIKEYEKFDVDWVRALIKEKEEDFIEVLSDGYKRRKILSEKKAKQVKELREEIENLRSILNSEQPSVMLKKFGYNMPYNNTDYMDETIIHELRKNHDLLQEILISKK
ncbi:hypothetical protein F4U02_16930 [Acinetobacter haemolyticus]|uniref:Uncharacterized protein n=1 Tax=Acinetobacter higginsii TaxID=70347 RepID=N8WAP0_9GAMM|nr:MULTISPECIES: hypothetical protein [Acinetobacter]ENV09152.1 hypothetical protein F966_01799 [Acinetobacter higginsii]MQZ32660.1 hypothetical protein [Acinetobacter haemolyticus]